MNETNGIIGIFDGLKAFPQTEAITLGGSRSTGLNDETSDYDVYVYVSEKIPEAARRKLLSEHCGSAEIGNRYWECEDNCVLNNGIPVDIIYRDMKSFDESLHRTVFECVPSNAYTTCMWHNLLNSRIIFDRSESLAALIKKAVLRNDRTAVTHRTAEFLASYYDVIFALNRLTHPGEKRLAEICAKQCAALPDNFEENLNRLFAELYTDKTPENVSCIVRELDILLENEKSKGGAEL